MANGDQGARRPQAPANPVPPRTGEVTKELTKPNGEDAKGLGQIDASKFPVLKDVGVDLITLGRTLAASGYFQDARSISQAIVKVLAGQELGIGPIRAMTEIHVVEGKVALGATLMASLLKRSRRYDYRIVDFSDMACEIEFLQQVVKARTEQGVDAFDWVPLGRSRFTMEDARKAGLLTEKRPSWQKYPRNMLFARAMSNGVRWHAPDIFGGAVYTLEELEDETAPPPAVPVPTAPRTVDVGAELPARPSGSVAVQSIPREAKPTAREEAPWNPSMDTPEQAKAREATMARIYSAMEFVKMSAEEMRGLSKTVYGHEPEQMPVDMLGLLAGRIEAIARGEGLGGAPPAVSGGEIDTLNKFVVSSTGAGYVVVGRPPLRPLSRDDALLLAAYLLTVAAAVPPYGDDVDARFAAVLKAVRSA